MKKRIFSLLLCIALCLSLLPTVAFAAATEYDIWVSGVQVTATNRGDVLRDGKVSYDPDTKTLTVADDAAITGNHDGAMIYTTDTGKLTIDGNLTLNGDSDVLYGVYSGYGNIEITGNADITVAKTNAAAIYAKAITVDGSAKLTAAGDCWNALRADTGNITIAGDVEITGFCYGLYASNGDITVKGSAEIEATAYAMYAYGDNGIDVGKNLTATVSGNGAEAIYASNGSVTVGGDATVQFNGAETENGDEAIYASKSITVTGDVEITGFHYGLSADNGDITMNGNAAIETKDDAIYAGYGKVVMKSGEWDISAGESAIRAAGGIEIPSTHAVTMPENGKIKTVDGNYTVTEVNGSTVAKHVIIKQNTASTIYTVSFNMNGHGNQIAAQTVNEGAKATKPADPTEIGYMFVGWYKDSAFNTVWNFDTDTVTENTTLNALWAQNIQKIIETLNVNVTAPAVGSHPDYSPVITATPNEVTSLCKVYLTPEWICADTESDLYNGNGTVMTAADTFEAGKYYAFSIQVNTLDAIVAGWRRSSTIVVTINGSVIDSLNHNVLVNTFGEDIGWLRAAWKMPDAGATATYTVNFNMNGHGTQVEAQTVKAGEKANKPADPTASGYTFGGWYADAACTTAFNFDTVINANTAIYAKWTKNSSGSGGSSSGGSSSGSSASATYAITVADSTHGSSSASAKTASAGDTVKITVSPDKGYTLETITVTDKNGKEVDLTATEIGKTYTFRMPSGAVTVKATFMDDNTMLNYFVDVTASDYYYDAVLWAAENGITGGVDAVHFAPNSTCTRAQAVTFLWRAAGCPEVAVKDTFGDVVKGSYYEKAVAWAVANGITSGTSATTFSPDADCTRAQIVCFLHRANKVDTLNIKNNPFTDVKDGAYYYNAVLWAAENGITGGTSATTFSPDANCTRAQIVTFLYRFMNK